MASPSGVLLAVWLLAAAVAFENMNGEYTIKLTPNGNGSFSTNFSEYPGGVEYFEVYLGPIQTLYSQVWWKTVPTVAIPPELVQRFDGKGMAIVGYETDSVRRTEQGDVSVPINMAYNHHHDVYLTGKHSQMSKVRYDPADLRVPPMARANPEFLDMPVETSASTNGLPTSLHLADGNGGEYRKSYHGFAAPVAYVIDSPQTVFCNPMFIDTWNRDTMNISGGSKFTAGPLPAHSEAPPGAPYSGLLECPLTTRIEKVFPGGSNGFDPAYPRTLFECASKSTRCGHQVETASECFEAAQATLGQHANVTTATGASDTSPPGCTVSLSQGGANAPAASIYFNTNNQSQRCCGADVASLQGKAASLVELEMTVRNDTVSLSLTGPADVWFGVGFFAQAMEDKPYTIIVDGDGKVSERVLASHMGTAATPAGSLIEPSIKLVSSQLSAGKRRVVLSRAAAGLTAKHASFGLQDTQIPYINAIGSTRQLSYHLNKTAASISLWPRTGQQVCVCKQPASPFGAAQGTIRYKPTGEEFGFINACSPEPRESVLADRNPTCDVRAYTGGLQVCKHMWSLLDADQEQPWPDQPLIFYQKYRFYYQEYDPAEHVIVLPRAVWAIGAFIGEYDVPQCALGTPVEQCTHEIWGVVTPAALHGDVPLHMASMHFHCHAPTCLYMEIVNNQTGELLCRQEPIYGSTGKIDLPKFDEEGYIAQPPCLWGDAPGLEPMPLVSGVSLTIRAVTNATVGHHGEMAFPEIGLVPWNSTTNKPQPGYSYTETVTTEWRLLDFNGRAGGRR